MQKSQHSELIDLLAKALQKDDFTEDYSLEHKTEIPAEMQGIMNKTELFFGQYWKNGLKEMGIKDSARNYSAMFPVNLLEKADLSIFEDVFNMAHDGIKSIEKSDDDGYEPTDEEEKQITDLFVNFDLVKLYDLLLSCFDDESDTEPEIKSKMQLYKPLFEALQKRVDKDFEKESEILGIPKDEMSEEQKLSVWQRSADISAQNVIINLMLAQKIPEMFNLLKKNGAANDFNNGVKENHPKIDFERKWYGLRRKFDCVLSFDELGENALVGLSPEEQAIEISDADFDKIIAGFLDALDDTDRTICYLKMDGKTQDEIAQELGYKNHSAVTKRMAKIREKIPAYIESLNM